MTHLYSIKFDFVELLKRKINEKEKEFYSSTIEALTSGEELLWKEEYSTTIPVSIAQSAYSSDILKEEFNKWMVSAKLLKENGNVEEGLSFFICIDITNVIGDKMCIQLFFFISEILKLLANKGVKFFIFSDSLPSENDVVWDSLKSEVQQESIFLINVKDGDFLPQKEILNYDKVRFMGKRKLLFKDKKYLLKQKLIRKLGHFKVEGKEHLCHRYFYDGSFCKDEIKSLLLEQINNIGNIELVIYSAQYSPWLKESMNLLYDDLQINNTEIISYEDINTVNNYSGGQVIFITDLIYSGDSLREMICNLFSKLTSIKNDALHIFSILNSEENQPAINDGGTRTIIINEKTFQITYFVNVTIDIKTAKEDCEMCKLGLPFDLSDNELPLKLKSYNFWELSDKAGYEIEKYGRESTKFMKAITIMNNWFNDNSAYIVYKYINSLYKIGIDVKIGSIFIYPKEEITGEELTPSNRLAESFKIFFNAKEIGIPRQIIDTYKDKSKAINEIDNVQEDWILALKHQSPTNNYIIIDEFHKDGETFESMMRILRRLNRNPKCFFPVINFNPNKKEKYEQDYNLKVLSLYEFNID
jgi:hypothetical protein